MAAKTTAYAYDRVTGRWRKDGRFCAPPTRNQLRADSSGRALDASGKIVPLSALPVSRTPPKPPKPAAKAPALTYDRDSGRWRKGGQWAGRPSRAQLRKDSKGRALDGSGKLVPTAALAPSGARRTVKEGERLAAIRGAREPKPTPPRPARPPKPKPKRKPKPKPKRKPTPRTPEPKPIKVGKLKRPRVQYLALGSRVADKPIVSSNHNTTHPDHIGDIAFNVLLQAAEKAGKDVDNIVLYQVGIEYLNTSQSGDLEGTMSAVNKLSRAYPEFSFKFAENRVHVLAGSPEVPLLVSEAAALLDRRKEAFNDIYERLAALWDDDIGWFFVAETDDLAEGYEG